MALITAQRKGLARMGLAWLVGVGVGYPVPALPGWAAPIWSALALVYWGIAAAEFWMITDPLWLARERLSYRLQQLAGAFVQLGLTADEASHMTLQIGRDLTRLVARARDLQHSAPPGA